MWSPANCNASLGLGKIRLGQPVSNFFSTYTADNGFEVLPIQINHLYLTEILLAHHKDPFDRLIVAQVKVEGPELISADSAHGYVIKRHGDFATQSEVDATASWYALRGLQELDAQSQAAESGEFV